MTRIDKFFVFIAVILIILFIASVLENIPAVKVDDGRGRDVSQILATIEGAGLEPKEAKYYKVIE